jgi:hypothetical protein
MNRWVIGGVFLGVTAAWLGSYWGVRSSFPNLEQSGQVGDLFGAVNALFSGLAFAGVIIAIWLQRKDLELQRDELRLQREEMAASRNQLATQAKAQWASVSATIVQMRMTALELEVKRAEVNLLHTADKSGLITTINRSIKAMTALIYDLEKQIGSPISDPIEPEDV